MAFTRSRVRAPLAPSSRSAGPVLVGSDDFRVRFSYWLDGVASCEEAIVTYRGRPRVRLSPAVPPLIPPLSPRTPRITP